MHQDSENDLEQTCTDIIFRNLTKIEPGYDAYKKVDFHFHPWCTQQTKLHFAKKFNYTLWQFWVHLKIWAQSNKCLKSMHKKALKKRDQKSLGRVSREARKSILCFLAEMVFHAKLLSARCTMAWYFPFCNFHDCRLNIYFVNSLRMIWSKKGQNKSPEKA